MAAFLRRCAVSRAGPRSLAVEAAFVRSIATRGIPVGERAQILVSAVAPHRTGASKDVAELLFKQGASSKHPAPAFASCVELGPASI